MTTTITKSTSSHSQLQVISLSQTQSVFLDVLRAVACIVIMSAHANQVFVLPFQSFYMDIHRLIGELFLMSFFSMSGFLVAVSVENARRTTGSAWYDIYLRKRIVRFTVPTYTALLFCLAISAFLLSWGFGLGSLLEQYQNAAHARRSLDINATDYLGSVVFLNAVIPGFDTVIINGPMWSVSFELWCCVLLPLVVAYYERGLMLAACTVVCVIGAICYLNEVWMLGMVVWAIVFLTTRRMMRKQMRDRSGYDHLEHILIIGSVALIALWATTYALWGQAAFFHNHYYYFGFGLSLAFPVIVFGMPTAKHIPSWIHRLSKYAQCSFTLYLTHFPWYLATYFIVFSIEMPHAVRIMIIGTSIIVHFILLSRIGYVLERIRFKADSRPT